MLTPFKVIVSLQLPVKMVRCGQHATLAVQLAASSASNWTSRKSTSFTAVPPIAEDEASLGTCSNGTTPTAPAGAFTCTSEAQPVSPPGQQGGNSPPGMLAQNGAGVSESMFAAENGVHSREAGQGTVATGLSGEAAQQLPDEALGAPALPASEVFREQQPCRAPGEPLQGTTSLPGTATATGAAIRANGSAAGVREGSQIDSRSSGRTNGIAAGAADTTGSQEDSYIEGRVGRSFVKLAQLHPAGSLAAQAHMLSDSAGWETELSSACLQS